MLSRYEILKAAELPTTTIFIPVTREWFIEKFLNGLDKVIIPKSSCELLFYIDSDSDFLWRRLMDYGRQNLSKFNGVKIYQSGRPAPTEVNPGVRRRRIVDLKEDSKRLINADSDFVFGLEDDTIAPPTAFIRLFKTINLSNVGFVEGVQVGRWNWRVLGAWRMDNPDNPTVVESLKPQKAGLTQIDGGGFYCYMTKADLYRQIDYRVEAECLGVDVNFCRDVRRRGYRAYIDWAVTTEHYADGLVRPEPLRVSDATQVVKFTKHGDKWTHELYDNSNGILTEAKML